MPGPQDALHDDQPDHAPITQSTAQHCVLHTWLMYNDGQAAPPFKGATKMLRLCDCVPLPQDALHDDQPDQALTTQSTGQPCTLQACSLNGVVLGQPLSLPLEHFTERVCVPPPHGTEQMLQFPVTQPQAKVLQS